MLAVVGISDRLALETCSGTPDHVVAAKLFFLTPNVHQSERLRQTYPPPPVHPPSPPRSATPPMVLHALAHPYWGYLSSRFSICSGTYGGAAHSIVCYTGTSPLNFENPYGSTWLG